MSDSVRPQRRQPTRLPRPWDSPGKNTGVGCHFLLQCMQVKGEREVAQSCLTLRDPMDCSPPGSSVHGSSQARGLEWVTVWYKHNLYMHWETKKLHDLHHCDMCFITLILNQIQNISEMGLSYILFSAVLLFNFRR